MNACIYRDTPPSHWSLRHHDAALFEAWREGDASAGEALFARHYGLAEAYFRKKVDAEWVADLVQDSLVACVEGRVRERASFRAYMLGVAHNVLCGHLRRRYRRGRELGLECVDLVDLGPGPAAVLDDLDSRSRLLDELRTLSPEHRRVLELYYWEQLSTREIAVTLGVALGTVRSRLMRARAALEGGLDRARRAGGPRRGETAAPQRLSSFQ